MTITSASPQTLADSKPQLIIHHDPLLHTYRGLFNGGIALPDPANLQPSPTTKRRTRADRRLLSELGRTANPSKRRSTHKAIAKRVFFLLSGRRRLQKSMMPPSYEAVVLQLDKKPSSSRYYRLPSFRDGFFSHPGHNKDLHSKQVALLSRIPGPSRRQGNPGLQLPSVDTLLSGRSE